MGKTTVDSQTSGDFHPGMEQRYGGGGSTTYAHPTNAHPTNAHRTNAHPTNAHMLIWKTTFAHNDYIYGERHLLATYFLLT